MHPTGWLGGWRVGWAAGGAEVGWMVRGGGKGVVLVRDLEPVPLVVSPRPSLRGHLPSSCLHVVRLVPGQLVQCYRGLTLRS